MARLFICNVANHKFLKRNEIYEERGGYVQRIESRQDTPATRKLGAYVGLEFPYSECRDALVEIQNT